jgi:hypothetical protein
MVRCFRLRLYPGPVGGRGTPCLLLINWVAINLTHRGLGSELLDCACILGLCPLLLLRLRLLRGLVIWFFPTLSLNHQETQINQKNSE